MPRALIRHVSRGDDTARGRAQQYTLAIGLRHSAHGKSRRCVILEAEKSSSLVSACMLQLERLLAAERVMAETPWPFSALLMGDCASSISRWGGSKPRQSHSSGRGSGAILPELQR